MVKMYVFLKDLTVIAFVTITLTVGTYFSGASNFDHNDFMYVGTAISAGHPYNDLHFVQGPLTYWFWRAVASLVQGDEIYTAMRIVSALLVAISIAVPAVVIFTKRTESVIFILLSFGSFYVLRAGWEVGNYSLTLVLTSLGVTALLVGGSRSVALGAFLLGAAATAKVSFVLLLLPGALAAILSRDRAVSTSTIMVIFGTGALAGLFPLLLFAFENPQNLLFHNVTFHSELTNTLRDLEISDSLHSIAKGMAKWLERELEVFVFLALCFFFAFNRVSVVAKPLTTPRVLSLTAFLSTSLAMAWAPMVLFPQYLAPASFFLCLLTTTVIGMANANRGAHFVAAITILALASASPRVFKTAKNALIGPEPAVIAEHNRITRRIQERAKAHFENQGEPTCRLVVTTLSGSLLAGSGMEPSIGSHTGPFWARLEGVVNPKQVAKFGLSQDLLSPERAIDRGQIDFSIVGYYPDRAYEQRIRESAIAVGFDERSLGTLNGRELYFLARPGC